MALNDDLNNLNDKMQEFQAAMKTTNNFLKEASTLYQQQSDDLSKIIDHKNNVNKLTKDEIESLKAYLKSNNDNLKVLQEQLKFKKKQLVQQLLEGDLSKKQAASLHSQIKKTTSLHREVTKELKHQADNAEDLTNELNNLKPITPISKRGEEQFEKFKEFGKNQLKSIKNAFSLSNIFTQIKKLILGLDESAGKFAKSMNVTYQEALLVR